MEVVTTTQGTAIALRSFPKVEGIDRSQLNMLPRLPETAEEVMSIAQATGADVARDVFLGERANEQTVKTMNLSGYRVIAFATHGLLPRDLDGLTQPALALTAPEVAGIQGDGLLTMEEILGLRLDADWIALSACNTASGNGAGAEAVSGLGRAFFYAGARALLVTHWPVETTSAKVLVTDVFRRQAQQPEPSRAEALRQAMLRHLDGPGFVDRGSNRIVFSYAHPIFWAPFSLVGDTGGIE
jgi:CHAT domain-containing protein